MVLKRLEQFDLAIFAWCMRRTHLKQYQVAARLISRTADGFPYIFVASLLWWLDDRVGTRAYWVMWAAFFVERIAYWILKNTLKRRRPPERLSDFMAYIKPSDRFSFPSGHTSAAFLFVSFMVYLYPATSLFWFAWAYLVALSRVFLGVHFPFDTVVGGLMGTFFGGLAIGSWML